MVRREFCLVKGWQEDSQAAFSMRVLSRTSSNHLIPGGQDIQGGSERNHLEIGKAKPLMKISTKLIATGAASLFGVALAVGGAYAATGSLTVPEAAGQVLKISGVGPAAAHASTTAKAHADANAYGLFGSTVSATPSAGTDATSAPEVRSTAAANAAGTAAGKAETPSPASSTAANSSSSTATTSHPAAASGGATSGTHVDVVAPNAAISLGLGVSASGGTR